MHIDKGFFVTDGGYEYNLILGAAAFALADIGPGPGLARPQSSASELSGPAVALAAPRRRPRRAEAARAARAGGRARGRAAGARAGAGRGAGDRRVAAAAGAGQGNPPCAARVDRRELVGHRPRKDSPVPRPRPDPFATDLLRASLGPALAAPYERAFGPVPWLTAGTLAWPAGAADDVLGTVAGLGVRSARRPRSPRSGSARPRWRSTSRCLGDPCAVPRAAGPAAGGRSAR